jgi:hypothetical protein
MIELTTVCDTFTPAFKSTTFGSLVTFLGLRSGPMLNTNPGFLKAADQYKTKADNTIIQYAMVDLAENSVNRCVVITMNSKVIRWIDKVMIGAFEFQFRG